MTRGFQTRTVRPRGVASIGWALGCGALLGALACESDSDSKLRAEPARAASNTAPAAAPSTAAPSTPVASTPVASTPAAAPSASTGAVPTRGAPNAAAPSGPVGLAKYEEPAADAPAAKTGETVKGTVVSDEAFSTWLQASSPVAAGAPVALEAVLEAKPGYHCNAEYPHKFKLAAAPAGLSYPEATVKGMQVAAERSVLRIPVVAESPGRPTVAGTLHFSVCNDERCLVEKRELSLNLEVK